VSDAQRDVADRLREARAADPCGVDAGQERWRGRGWVVQWQAVFSIAGGLCILDTAGADGQGRRRGPYA